MKKLYGDEGADLVLKVKNCCVSWKKYNTFVDRAMLDIPVNDLNDIDKVVKGLLEKLDAFEKTILAKKGLRAGSSKSMQEFRGAYDRFGADIDEGERRLEVLRGSLLRHVSRMERMHGECLAIVKEFDMYILAAEQALADNRNGRLAELSERAKRTGLMEDSLRVEDFLKALDRLEKKKHGLSVTRALPWQTMAQIRLIQETDALIAENLNNLIAHVFPLYKSRIVLSLTVKENGAPLVDADEFSETTAFLREALEGILKARKIGIARQRDSFRLFG